MKTQAITLVSLFFGSCIIAGAVFYTRNGFPWFRGQLPNCVAYHSGTVKVDMRYPNEFVVLKYPTLFQVYRQSGSDISRPANESPLLSIDNFGIYVPVERLISESETEPGPRPSKVIVNGHDAALAQFDGSTSSSPMSRYEIPIGNRVIRLDSRRSSLASDSQRQLFDKMFRSITFTQVGEDVKMPRVEQCGS